MTASRGQPRTLLLVEDNPGDAELMRELLEDPLGRDNRVAVAGTLAEAAAALAREPFDAVLLDLGLPDATGAAGVEALRSAHDDVPVVVLTGLDDEAAALECLAAGAQDYLAKADATIETLRRAVAYAIARQEEQAARTEAEELQARLAMIVETSHDAIISLSPEGAIETWNAGAERIFGFSAAEAVGRPVGDVIRPLDPDQVRDQGARLTRALADDALEEVVRLRRDGPALVLDSSTRALKLPSGETIGLAAILRDVTDKRRQEDELRRRNEDLQARGRQMRALAARLNAVREEERIRISREVHDELGQLLTGVKMDLRWMDRHLEGEKQGVWRERLSETTGLVDRTIGTVQRIATELRPSALDALGLASALRDEARRFEARCAIAVAFDVHEGMAPPQPVATAVFRIFQEILANVARHAQATRLDIGLDLRPTLCMLTARDNGVGFTPDADGPEALGLLGMRERAAEFGGDIVIESGRGAGTRVTVRIPLG